MGTYFGRGSVLGAGEITYTPGGDLVATDVESALNELDAAKVPKMPGAPNGFRDRDEVTLSWDAPTRTLTITPVGADFTVYSGGNTIVKTGAEQKAIPDTEGQWFIYYDENGDLQTTQLPEADIILRWALVCFLYWDATNKQAIPEPLCELHEASMAPITHLWAHSNLQTLYSSGLDLTLTTEGSGDDDAHAQFVGSEGLIFDEDIPHTIPEHLAASNDLRILYQEGAEGTWRMSPATSLLALATGTGRAAWNNPNAGGAGVWGLSEIANNDFALAHIYVFPGVDCGVGRYVILMGQGDYATIIAARAAAPVEAANLSLKNLPVVEGKIVASVILQTSDSYANAVKTRTRNDADGNPFVDWIQRVK